MRIRSLWLRLTRRVENARKRRMNLRPCFGGPLDGEWFCDCTAVPYTPGGCYG